MHIESGNPGDADYRITCHGDPTRPTRWLGLWVTAVSQIRGGQTRTRDRVLAEEHLLLCQSGSGSVTSQGVTRQLQAGEIMWLPADTPHSYENSPAGWSIWALQIGGPRAAEWVAFCKFNRAQPVLRLAQTGEVIRHWSEVIQLMKARPVGHLLQAALAAQQVFAAIRLATAALPDERLRMLRMLTIHSRDLDKIALAAGMSKGHFIRRFRQATGTTPYQHIVRLRLDRAKELLADPSLSIAEIAARVGLDDPNYFSRLFQKHVGVPPSRFRVSLLT